LTVPAFAATDIVEVYFLSMQEAADVARSQLSEDGTVAVIASRNMLLIDDDTMHIQKAKAWLKRLDHPPGQYTAYVSIEDDGSATHNALGASGYIASGKLAGGWLIVKLQNQIHSSSQRQSFQLRISGHHPGSMETGEIRAFSRETRRWLSRYGIVRADHVELVRLTSGFNITVTPAGTGQVRVHIVPWMKRVAGEHQPRSALNEAPVIEIAGAATELLIPVETSVTLAAAHQEAAKLSAALLSASGRSGQHQFIIHLRVSKE